MGLIERIKGTKVAAGLKDQFPAQVKLEASDPTVTQVIFDRQTFSIHRQTDGSLPGKTVLGLQREIIPNREGLTIVDTHTLEIRSNGSTVRVTAAIPLATTSLPGKPLDRVVDRPDVRTLIGALLACLDPSLPEPIDISDGIMVVQTPEKGSCYQLVGGALLVPTTTSDGQPQTFALITERAEVIEQLAKIRTNGTKPFIIILPIIDRDRPRYK